jgi:hypothetical protein
MEKQMAKEETKGTSESKGNNEGLPLNDSPYLKYKDLEDYKEQGYGTHGHQQPKEGRGPGGTEAPTFSGADAPSKAHFNTTDVVHSKRET